MDWFGADAEAICLHGEQAASSNSRQQLATLENRWKVFHTSTMFRRQEETDNTVTVETTPSSANITPSQSSEWPHSPTSLSASAKLMMTTSGVSFTTIQAPRCHQKILREKKTPSGSEGPKPSLNPNRASYPGALVTSATSATSSEAGSGEGNSLIMSTTSSSSSSSSGERLSTVGTDDEAMDLGGSAGGSGQEGSGSLSGLSSLQSPVAADSNLDLPEWMVCGESVILRQSNYSGIIAFIGATDFAAGLWIGIELDAPLGKNDGSVKGVRYFSCGAKRGVFVRADKVLLDKRGRSVRNNNPSTKQQQENNAGVMRRSVSKGKLKNNKSASTSATTPSSGGASRT